MHMNGSLSRKGAGLIIILFLVSRCPSCFAFPTEKELADLTERSDKKYFPVFLQTIDMINKKQFQDLPVFYDADLLSDNRINTEPLSFETLKRHKDIFFYDPKSLLKEGYRITFPIDWSADPLKNSTWVLYFQNLFWLNDYLQRGAKGDGEAALTAFKIIKDWLVSNVQWPPKNGKFVYDDHGMSERLGIFHKAVRLYKKTPYRDDEFYNLLLTGIVNHIALMSTKEKYNWNNHGIILDSSLLGVLNDLKEFKTRAEVIELASQRILRQFRLAFTSEGVHREHSPCYHVWVTSFMLNSLFLIEKTGKPVPDDIKNIVDNTAEFNTHILKTDRTVPLFGDCSEGQSAYTSDAIAARFYNDHLELKYVMSYGREGARPRDKIKIFPESGWAVFRDKWPPDIYAVVQSDFHSNVHYHGDDTSFVISAYGNDLISDSGMYTYERDVFSRYGAGSAAHNVLLIDDMEFNPDMNKTGLSGITRFLHDASGGIAMVELTHPHYSYLGVNIHRQFGMIGPSDFAVRDIMESKTGHKSTQLLHFAPGAHIESVDDTTFRISWEKHPHTVWIKSDYDAFDVVEGSMNPVQGWYFPKFGVAVPNPVLRLHKKQSTDEFLTLISISTQQGLNPDWNALEEKSIKLIKTIEKMPRRVLSKETIPQKWIPSREKQINQGS